MEQRKELVDRKEVNELLHNFRWMQGRVNQLRTYTPCYLGSPCEYQNEDIKMQPQTGWIPVTERLPEDYQRVLVTIVNYAGDKVVRVAEYRNRIMAFQIKENNEKWEVGEKGLLAWMPMPKPYEEGETEA